MAQSKLPFTSSTRYKLFENPVILTCIIEGIGSSHKATLAKIMRVNKACLTVAAKVAYRDVTRIGPSKERLHLYLNRIGVPHERRHLYKSSVQEMVVTDICYVKSLDTPTMISLYPNLVKISFNTEGNGLSHYNPAKVILRRTSSSQYTFDTLSIECPLTGSTSGDVLALYGLNPATGKGFHGIELTALEFTGGKECFCMEDSDAGSNDSEEEEDVACSGYEWLYPLSNPTRTLSPLRALKVLDLGGNPCKYSQLMILAGAIPEVTHLTVCLSTYGDEGTGDTDHLKSLAMKLRNLEELVFRETKKTSKWSLSKAIINLTRYCLDLKVLQLPIDLAVTKSTGRNLLKRPTLDSMKHPLDHQRLSSLRIIVDSEQISELHSLQFAYILLHSVSKACEVEVFEGNDISDCCADDTDWAVKVHGQYRDKVTWGKEVLASKEIVLEELGVGKVSEKKGWKHLGSPLTIDQVFGSHRISRGR